MTLAGCCIFLNGLPGSGKSTYARALVAGREGWLNLDVDLLRGLLGSAAVDFVRAGAEVQPLVLAVLREHVARGGTVVFPQLFFVPEEAAPFEHAVREAGGRVVRLVLHEDPDECWRRVQQRSADVTGRQIAEVLAAAGGVDELCRIERQLAAWSTLDDPPRALRASTPQAEVVALAAR